MLSLLASLSAKIYSIALVQLVWQYRQTKQVREIKIVESQTRLGATN